MKKKELIEPKKYISKLTRKQRLKMGLKPIKTEYNGKEIIYPEKK